MFKKPFKIKSNTQTKASERKSFINRLLTDYPVLTDNEINEFLPKKDGLNILKTVTHDNETVQVYTVQKRPVVFEIAGRLFPTIFLLWKFPNLIYAFTTHQQVMKFITSGADLMLPGVVTPSVQSGLSKYGNVAENDIVYVNLSNNKAAIAVGVTCQSSGSMAMAHSRGKCVNIYHFQGDHLCTLEAMPNCPVPDLGPPEWLILKSYDEEFPEIGATPNKPELSADEQVLEDLKTEEVDQDQEQLESANAETKSETIEDVDNLLCYCFLGALKYSKTLTLPVLSSNFFKLHMIPLCPADKTLDIKKSSYKKLKPFLEKMAADGLITLKEVKKGVESITALNKDHPRYTSFYIDAKDRPKSESSIAGSAPRTDVVESFIITQTVLPLFIQEGLMKGDTVQISVVKNCVTKYITDNNLQAETNARLVQPKDTLATICKTNNLITREEVLEKVCEAMKNCFKVKSGTEEIVNKGKVSPITMTVAVRSGNKKVTLVDNLELFGISLNEFAKECQHGVAASTSISRPPGKKYDQLLIQGNQVLFVHDLLTDKYKVPKKYIRGLENAPKRKK